MTDKRKKIVLAKVGLDGHDNGLQIVSMWLVEAGYEVVYAGLYNTPERVVKTVLEEDAGAIGLSFLGGGHLHYARTFVDLLREKDLADVKLIIGGVIPPSDVEALGTIGVDAVFTPGTRKDAILQRLSSFFTD